ncbi:MAG TPA: DNA-binding domain-containing protein, partial [Sphingomonadales bacterium]|nr:DNA-binding domain-containing protein [Sphingomonadales bacterium]
PSLDAYQRAFTRYLRSGEDTVIRGLTVSGRTAGAGQLQIYRNNFVLGLEEALATTFVATKKLVGEDYFHFAARAFTGKFPPVTPVLARYGERFPAFLRTLSGLERFPFVPDVAAFEWARNRALTAPEDTPLSSEAFAARVAGNAGGMISLAPSVTLITSRFPLQGIFDFSMGRCTDTPILGHTKVRYVVIYRSDGMVMSNEVSSMTFRILRTIEEGRNLEKLLAKPVNEARQSSTIAELGALVAKGILTGGTVLRSMP